MASVKIQAGAEIDILSPPELRTELAKQTAAEWVAEGAGVKALRFVVRPNFAVSSTAGYVLNVTPQSGFIWSLRFIGSSLSSAQTQQYYLGTDTNTGLTVNASLAPLANAASAIVGSASFGRGQVMMEPDDFIVFYAGGSATLQTIFVQVWEVPTQLAWKVK